MNKNNNFKEFIEWLQQEKDHWKSSPDYPEKLIIDMIWRAAISYYENSWEFHDESDVRKFSDADMEKKKCGQLN